MKILISVVSLYVLWLTPVNAQQHRKHSSQPSLRGTRAAMVRQNKIADQNKLTRIKNNQELARFKAGKLLVPLPENGNVRIDPRLPEKYRYVRPYTYRFVLEAAQQHRKAFPFAKPLQINSAVRTAEYQQYLRKKKRNRNAAPAKGKLRSSHLTGATIDIAKKGRTAKELEWMRSYLRNSLLTGDLVVVTEEKRQSVFHIMVSPKYKG